MAVIAAPPPPPALVMYFTKENNLRASLPENLIKYGKFVESGI